jgi:hypothetical protein
MNRDSSISKDINYGLDGQDSAPGSGRHITLHQHVWSDSGTA